MVLQAPKLPMNIPENAQWLAGEGAGSWFTLDQRGAITHVERYSPTGKLECEGDFEGEWKFDEPYQIDYPSHCAIITIKQNNKRLTLRRV